MKKLHLGCGQRYLEGYINIDFPLTEHTVQTRSIADEFHDITVLSYAPNSIDEVRLHHVFEHFDRPTACALVASWNTWLHQDGVLHIEVPDFEKTARAALSFLTTKNKKKVAIRHLFGSHEAPWAIHAEGYSEWMLKDLLECFGFEIKKTIRQNWKGTFNLELIAKKKKYMNAEEMCMAAEQYLKSFLLDDTELSMLEIWLVMFKKQFAITSARQNT